MRRHNICLAALFAALAGGCLVETGDPVETTELEGIEAFAEHSQREPIILEYFDPLTGSDCTTAEECEAYLEQTLSQCLNACQLGIEAIERFCDLIPVPAIQASCYAMRFGGPILCSNWCYWYFSPH